MAFEDIKAQIAMLLADTQEQPENLHAVYQKVMQEINEMKAFGMPLPEDLVELERALEERFSQDMPQT
jgi:hypothetical protein